MPTTHIWARWGPDSAWVAAGSASVPNMLSRLGSTMGAPYRASRSAQASLQASSSAISARWVMASVITGSGACSSQSSTARRSSTSWRNTRSAAGMSSPCSRKAARACLCSSRVGTPGGRQASSPA